MIVQHDVVAYRQRGSGIQFGRAVDQHVTRAKRRIVPKHQPACVQRNAAGEGIGVAQRQGGVALLIDATDAADHAVERNILRAWQGQRAIQGDCIAQRHGGACIQCGTACGGQGARAQRRVAANQQRTALQLQPSAPGVVAVEGQCLRACLDQAAGAIDRAVEREVLSIDRQRTVGGERVLQGHRSRCGEQRAVGGSECPATERGIAAHDQGAVVQHGAAGVTVVSVERERSGALLDQAASAAHGAGQAQGVVADQRQRTIQHHIVAKRGCRGGLQLRAAGCGQRTAAQCRAAADRQATRVEIHTASEGVRAGQRQRCSAVFDQATDAADATSEGQVLAAAKLQIRIQHHVVGHHACSGAIEQAATHVQAARPECAIAAQNQTACRQTGAAQIAVVAAEGQAGRAEFVQAAGATDASGQRERVAATHSELPC